MLRPRGLRTSRGWAGLPGCPWGRGHAFVKWRSNQFCVSCLHSLEETNACVVTCCPFNASSKKTNCWGTNYCNTILFHYLRVPPWPQVQCWGHTYSGTSMKFPTLNLGAGGAGEGLWNKEWKIIVLQEFVHQPLVTTLKRQGKSLEEQSIRTHRYYLLINRSCT